MGNIIIAVNCKKVDEVPSDKIKSVAAQYNGQGLMDDRHNIYSFDNTLDLPMYYNYLETIKALAQESNVGRLKYLLDLGYMPVVMSPFFMFDSLHSQIIPALEKHNIPYKKMQASSFIKDWYTNDNPDIWVSKLDCASFLNKRPEQIRVKDLLEEIL